MQRRKVRSPEVGFGACAGLLDFMIICGGGATRALEKEAQEIARMTLSAFPSEKQGVGGVEKLHKRCDDWRVCCGVVG